VGHLLQFAIMLLVVQIDAETANNETILARLDGRQKRKQSELCSQQIASEHFFQHSYEFL